MSRKFLDETGLSYLWGKLKTLFAGKVDKVSGKGLSTNDFTTTLKSKLDGIEAEANKTIVDGALSTTSTNPVENNVVNTALENLNTLKVDKVAGKALSTNDFTTTLKNKLDGIETGANKTIVDSALSTTSTNPVQNKVVDAGLALKINTADIINSLTSSETTKPLGAAQGKILREDPTFRSYATNGVSPFFTRLDGKSNAISTVTNDISTGYSSNNWGVLYEYFRTTIFGLTQYGGGGGQFIANAGPLTCAGLFIAGNGNYPDWLSTNLRSYFTTSGIAFSNIDSFKVEVLGGAFSMAECTIKFTMFTKTAKEYELLICATNASSPTYTTDGWVCLSETKVDKEAGKGLSSNDFTSTLLTKLNGIETGANKTIVDAALNTTSTNPVQNKIINTALGNKVDKVAGKALSTNDFTDTFKAKLENQAENPYNTFLVGAGFKYGETTTPGTITSGVSVVDLSDFAKKADISSVYKAKGSIAFASLPALTSSEVGDVYNITNEFTTTSSFIEGAGKTHPAGTNVVCIISSSTKYWDVLAGSVDLSSYQKIADLVAITNAEIDTILAS
ncbi:MAG: hypothetical protein WCU90_10615 [Kiritimatiellia bacterium]